MQDTDKEKNEKRAKLDRFMERLYKEGMAARESTYIEARRSKGQSKKIAQYDNTFKAKLDSLHQLREKRKKENK